MILTIYGRVSFLSMARHGDSCESRFRQNFKRKFDWCAFNSGMLLEGDGHGSAIALDHSFLDKSGTKTPGLDRYWSGYAGSVKRGLEILGFAQFRAGVSDARFLFAVQTLPLSTGGRTPFYLEHMKENRNNQTAKCLRAIFEHREQLLGISDILVGDCLFASHDFVTGAARLGFNVISRLRDDAVLQYLYNGPRMGGPGHPKELDGTVDIHDLRDDVFVRETVELDGQEAVLFSAVVKGKSLKRKIKVVVAELRCGDRKIRKILFSTDTGISASGIFLIYHSRFRIEFLYRDAKQNTGFEHWQSTDSDRLSFGYNASLSAVNVAREVSDRIHEATGRRLSVTSVKRVLHNASLYQHIREFIEGRKSGDLKNNNGLTEEIPSNLLFFGVRDSA
ncbi:MAG: hypothetical protein K2M83_08725 [Muribaculaceae bacterium]|nr:hypothetical protein [Muribaculaceae bacterium]